MSSNFVCPWCQADRYSERFHIPMPEGRVLVLCAHTAAQIHDTLHTIEGTARRVEPSILEPHARPVA